MILIFLVEVGSFDICSWFASTKRSSLCSFFPKYCVDVFCSITNRSVFCKSKKDNIIIAFYLLSRVDCSADKSVIIRRLKGFVPAI